jgi:hypothetical protein
MGTYASISLITHLSIPKETMEKQSWTLEGIAKELEQYALRVSLFEGPREQDGYWVWELGSEVAQGILPFLKDFYPDYYRKESSYQEILRLLSEGADWEELAEGKSEEAFQIDHYAPGYYLYHPALYNQYLPVYCRGIHLALEGKMMAESYKTMFSFLTACMQERYQGHAVAGALQLYITQ